MNRKIVSIAVVLLLATLVACGAPAPEEPPPTGPPPTGPPPAGPPPAGPPPAGPPPAEPPPGEPTQEVEIFFHSVATPGTPGEQAVKVICDLLIEQHPWIIATWKYVALPDALIIIDQMPPDQRKLGFIGYFTPMDFHLARAGAGPEQHKFEKAYNDLMFVGTVGGGGWTFLTTDPEVAKDPRKLAGRRVGVNSTPAEAHWGAPDVLSNSIVTDAWGMSLDDIEWVKCMFPSAGSMLEFGVVDAAFWGMANNMSGQFTIPEILYTPLKKMQFHWVPLTQADADKVNAANIWKISLVNVPKDSLKLPGPYETVNPPEDVTMADFTSILAAWADTEEELVYELIKFFADNADKIKEANLRLNTDPESMAKCAGVTADMVHPGALRFYQERGVQIP